MKRFGNLLFYNGLAAIILPLFGYTFRSLQGETYGVCFATGIIFVIIGLIMKSLSN